MCEYMILEDYKMEQYIYNEQNGLWYELRGDYYIPCLELPAEKEERGNVQFFAHFDSRIASR